MAGSSVYMPNRSTRCPSFGIWANVRVREVGAPEHPLRRGGDERLRERDGVREGGAVGRDSLATAYLYPRVRAFHQPQQFLERRLLEAVARLHPRHVVDRERHRQPEQQRRQLNDVLSVQVDDEVPAHGCDALSHALHDIRLRDALQVTHEVESDGADAAFVVAGKFRVGDVRIHDARAPVRSTGPRDGIERRVHVDAVATRVDDDRPRDAKVVVERLQCLLRRVGRRVGTVRVVGEDVAGAEYMAVGVTRVRRQLQVRFFGVRVRSGDRAYLAFRHRAAASASSPFPVQTSAGM